MARGYSASRTNSKRPTLRLKRERSMSMTNLRKTIDARAAKTEAATAAAAEKPAHPHHNSSDVMKRKASAHATNAKATAAASVPQKDGKRGGRSKSAGDRAASGAPASRSASKALRVQLAEMEEELDSEMEASEDERETIAKPDVMVKYKTIGKVIDEVLDILALGCVPGASTKALCDQGDLEITSRLKTLFAKTKDAQGRKLQRGLCYPTNISVNEVVCNHSPFHDEDALVLRPMQVVKIHCGCHLDGYPVMAARTVVVGPDAASSASPADAKPNSSDDSRGHSATFSKSSSNAIEAARVALAGMIRMLRPGTLNADITDFIAAVGHSYGAEAIEGVLSNRVKRWVLDGMDCIINRRIIGTVPQHDVDECTVEEQQVWALDVAFTNRLGTDEAAGQSVAANEEEEEERGVPAGKRDRALGNADDTKCFRTTPTEEAACIFRRTPMDFATDARVQQANEVLTEITDRFGCFPFHFKHLSNPLRGKMGINVLAKHEVVDKMVPLRVKNSLSGRRIAARFCATVAVTGKRITVLCGAPPEEPVGSLVLPEALHPQPVTGALPDLVAETLSRPLEFATAAALRAAKEGQPSTKRTRPE